MLSRTATAKLRKQMQNGLKGVAVALTGEAKKRATRHVYQGTRRNSITHLVRDNSVYWGIPKGSAPHAVHLEFGFKPHWVSMAKIAFWARRNGAGTVRARSQTKLKSGKRSKRTRTFLAAGVFVGGPGSSLDYGPGGALAKFFKGRGRRVTRSYQTRGRYSRYIAPGKVGHAILRPTIQEDLKRIAPQAFVNGYRRAK